MTATPATDPDNVRIRTQIDEILYSGRNVPPHIRMFLHEVDRFAAAHACPLPDEEIEFIGQLHARYGRARSSDTSPQSVTTACQVAGVTISGPADNVAAAHAALEPPSTPTYPDELTPELREALGWPNFCCGPVAYLFRTRGYPIAQRAEDEQAFVLHWLTKLVLRHGQNWRQKAHEELADLADSPMSA